MKKMITVMILTGMAVLPGIVCAAEPAISLRDHAPIYAGPFQEGDLEELTIEDFSAFGVDPADPEEQYRRYQEALKQPSAGMLVPYKLRIIDRDLAREDFLGFGVTEELAEARYEGYLEMVPDSIDGQTVHYVYVYHLPLSRAEAEASRS